MGTIGLDPSLTIYEDLLKMGEISPRLGEVTQEEIWLIFTKPELLAYSFIRSDYPLNRKITQNF